MTLIAFTKNYGVPFVVGDILVSSEERTRSIQLPTNYIDINEHIKFKGAAPSDLVQKIYIIRKNLCVALAGRLCEMKDFLTSLITYCNYYKDVPITAELIHTFIREKYDFSNFLESAFLIVHMEVENYSSADVKVFNYPKEFVWGNVDSEMFDSVLACGTGKETFLRRVSENVKFESSHLRGDINQAIQTNICLFSRLFAEEKISGNTTKNFWGAGFETILHNGDSFIKFPEITYVISLGFFDVNGDIKMPLPNLIMHYKYYEDTLLIRAIEIKKGMVEIKNGMVVFTATQENLEVNIFEVPQLHIPPEFSKYERPSDLSFHTYRTGLGYAFMTEDRVLLTPAFFSDTQATSVKYTENEKMEIQVSSGIIDRIKSEAKVVFPNLKRT